MFLSKMIIKVKILSYLYPVQIIQKYITHESD